ncbi:MBL fold metallo-hydrolase [Curvivirga sp.]|uniref:MBL fold metallo-hydrolase n=1 Tax=Curvivirga sp. TaxID=2856848 RepID=UPI003B58FEEC
MFKILKALTTATALVLGSGAAQAAEHLKVNVFNPGDKSFFPVTSTLITGETEAILVDAQFHTNDAESVVNMIAESQKKLKAIYISDNDPDFYFGLDTILTAYPDTPIYAAPKIIQKIEKAYKGKLAYWGPKLEETAPKKVIIPSALPSNKLSIGGHEVRIVGADDSATKGTYIWLPSMKTVVAGVSVYENVHVWMADSQTKESRDQWRKVLNSIEALEPKQTIPGHFLGKSDYNLKAVTFTKEYVANFEEAAAASKNSEELVEKMKKLYPDFTNIGDLELSAKVIMGEMSWGS